MFGKASFKGGVHPPHSKASTEALPIEILPPPPKVVIPLSQHIGGPAKITVKKGDMVKIGDMLGEAGGFVSAPVHASVSGKVTAIGDYPHPSGRYATAIEIENDWNDSFADAKPVNNWQEAAPAEIVQHIQWAGIVGMGGASFPSHVKLSPPSGKKIDLLIINGAECEPYLTADHRLMLEKTGEVLTGIQILKKILNANKVYIGIEENKPDAIRKFSELCGKDGFERISVATLRAKYPQGGEKQLINAVTGRQVPSGGLPMDARCVVHNVGTAMAVRDAVIDGIPLYRRVVTVTGTAINKPANLLVRIGTPMRYVLDYCGAEFDRIKKIIMGGPMMGLTQSELDAPVLKATSGILTLDETCPGTRAWPCISCGNCVKACPIHLVPSILAKFAGKDMYGDADEWNVLDCMECGSCAYVCPSKINLVHFMKLAKYNVNALRSKAKEKR